METYFVEHYQPGVDAAGLRRAALRLRYAAAALGGEAGGLRYVRSTIVPEDEAFFSLLEARSERLVREAHARAGVPFERITRAIDADRRPHYSKEER